MGFDISNQEEEENCLVQLKSLIRANKEMDRFSELFQDRFLLHFIRAKKFDAQRAFTTTLGQYYEKTPFKFDKYQMERTQPFLDNYLKVRRLKYRELFKSLRPSTTTALETGTLEILVNRDHLQRLVVVFRIGCWDPRRFTYGEIINLSLLSLEEIWNCKSAEINGIVGIVDLEGFSMKHALSVTPHELAKTVSLLWANFPLRPQAIHYVNDVYIFSVFLKTITRLLAKKMVERMHFHNSHMESLHRHIRPEILPTFLGGMLENDAAFDTKFVKRIKDKEGYYQKFAEYI